MRSHDTRAPVNASEPAAAQAASTPDTPQANILDLQQSVGNQAVSRMLAREEATAPETEPEPAPASEEGPETQEVKPGEDAPEPLPTTMPEAETQDVKPGEPEPEPLTS